MSGKENDRIYYSKYRDLYIPFFFTVIATFGEFDRCIISISCSQSKPDFSKERIRKKIVS